jgi:precorrin-8X/cobalt-precorrin-8 methylmutase
MESILLIGHGSPKKDANNIEVVAALLHSTVHPGCTGKCVQAAYLQFSDPDIMGAIAQCVDRGSKKIIIHPYFLSSGMHVTKDIPDIIQEARGLYPDVQFIYTEPLGIHEKLVQVVIERIRSSHDFLPADIEKRSFEIISEEEDMSNVPQDRLPIVKRVIHATADFDFKKTLVFHPRAIETGLAAIKAGKTILADVEMVRAGINRRWLQMWGGKVVCGISDEDVVRESKETEKTRAELAMQKYLTQDIGIIAIGNAPTALLKIIELLNAKPMKEPPLVVGVPVGFVKAYESKALLAAQDFPFITTLSRKGGTPVAVAIVNALLKTAAGE